MPLVSLTSVLTATVPVAPDGTQITVDSAALNGNSHFIILHIEATDTAGGVHFIDPVRTPLDWRKADDTWAKRLSRHMLILPAAYHAPVLPDDLHAAGDLFGLRDLSGQSVDFLEAHLTLLAFN